MSSVEKDDHDYLRSIECTISILELQYLLHIGRITVTSLNTPLQAKHFLQKLAVYSS